MAKVTKSVLKGIVKECLVEILSEGINAPAHLKTTKNLSGVSRRKATTTPRRPALDNVTFGNKVDEVTSTMTDDPVMSAIFADTARTTLQEQFGADSADPRRSMMALAGSSGQSDQASQIVSNNNIEDLFDGAGNWATLAFAEKKSR